MRRTLEFEFDTEDLMERYSRSRWTMSVAQLERVVRMIRKEGADDESVVRFRRRQDGRPFLSVDIPVRMD